MSKRALLTTILFIGVGGTDAYADVVVVPAPPERVELKTASVSVEPFACPLDKTHKPCPQQAKPRGNPENWLTPDDYPARSSRLNQSGAVILRCEIDREILRPKLCSIVTSSGFELLDNETSRALVRRARFQPQPIAQNPNVPLYFDVRVVWVAPWVEFF
jgi:periplasmic protein TonB